MGNVDRRTALCVIAAAVLAATGDLLPARADAARGGLPAARVPAPAGVLTRLPGDGNQLAFTVDDGTSTAVVAAFADFCRDTGTRMTFFVNGANKSWTDNAPALQPMVDSGQVQLGNHTWSHPDITRIGVDAVADQIRRNADFLKNTYGVDGTPFFRPPYGRHNADTDRVAATLGYPTITMWSATIGDSAPENATSLIANARNSFQAQQIVLGHANLPTITHCYAQLIDIISTRNLQTVTLNDVFG
ncbi:polysaccharide deacetylase family protein [Mycobacterium sp.]|uniref:polysaccharide deacetylase family protein n=1 Tax=Mycobacterium sp. TaxID=1785 RepID=UPI002BAAEB3C|nr:polysaccharide deacetylase family protein [Mycobacterium sp.]HME46549.1 polysaccharide deacetylase family protein [Mycobacterium sp.]